MRESEPIPLRGQDHKGHDPAQDYQIALLVGSVHSPHIDGLRVQKDNQAWKLSDNTASARGVDASARLFRGLGGYATFLTTTGGDLTSRLLSVGPEHRFSPLRQRFFPKVRVGAVYGSADWSGTPGTIEGGWGFELGGGCDYQLEDFFFGGQLMYRRLTLDFDPGTAASSEQEIDLSGWAGALRIGYSF